MSRRFKRVQASKGRSWRDLRLSLERLEPRQLLAGLNVWVVSDQNGSRSFDETVDTSAANRLVYVDLDRDSVFDHGEPLAVTNREGLATFSDLLPGTYQVAIVGTNSAQVQSFPVAPATQGLQRSSANAAFVIASNDLTRSWSVSDDGTVSELSVSRSVQSPFALGGKLLSYVQPIGDVAWGIVRAGNSATSRLVRMDLNAGTVREIPINGIGAGSQLVELSRVGEQLVAGLSTPEGPRVASLAVRESSVSVGSVVSLDFSAALAGSPAGQWLATATNLSSIRSRVALSDVSADGSAGPSVELDGQVEGLHFSRDGRLLLATLIGGGTRVLRVGRTLAIEAELAEATEPISINSVDGRIVTGNAQRPSELIVWNPETWQPTGRVALRSTGSLNSPVATSAVTDHWGDRLLVATTHGTYEVELAVPVNTQAVVGDQQVSNVRLGVRVVAANSPPIVSGQITRTFNEDSIDEIGRNALVEFVRDSNGNPLWFTVDAAPRHGRLSLSPDGGWRYQPVEDYYGEDRAVLQVHDGMASSSLTVSIIVEGVNDPPRGMQFDFAEILETASQGTSLGFITVFDIDRDAQYVFTTSDPRFIVVDGQLMLSATGSIDFETERTIVIDVTATDASRSDISITRQTTIAVADVNELPTGILLSNTQVSENQRGAVVGTVSLDDPDQVDDVFYEVSDERFEIVGGQLRLRANAELDHEHESSIVLVVTARTLDGPATETSSIITITVYDENDPPQGIVLSSNVVLARTPGFVVGTLAVQDPDIGQSYRFSVSDTRFEVAGQNLKLKDGQALSLGRETIISLTVSATSPNGDSVSEQVELQVQENTSSQQNPHNPLDVDGDGHVTPRDALILINYLNQFGPQFIDPDQGSGEGPFDPDHYIDVNDDGAITPIDVLIIINHLNNASTIRPSGEGEGLAFAPRAQALPVLAKPRDKAEQNRSAQVAPSIESPIGGSKHHERITGTLAEKSPPSGIHLPRNMSPGPSEDLQAVRPIYGPLQPGSFSGDDKSRETKELDLELESLLDELSLEQMGRFQED